MTPRKVLTASAVILVLVIIGAAIGRSFGQSENVADKLPGVQKQVDQNSAAIQREIDIRTERVIERIVELQAQGVVVTEARAREVAREEVRNPSTPKPTARPEPPGPVPPVPGQTPRPPLFPTPTPRPAGTTPGPTPVSGPFCSVFNCETLCRVLGLFCQPIEASPVPPTPPPVPKPTPIPGR